MTEVTPVVSVVTITYNHEEFVAEALQSFVDQEVDFPIEVIVADNASTDRTPEIIQLYTDRYPQLFRPVLRSKNVGAFSNLIDALSASRGTFIALCEGDDYWTDPHKLAKQVAYLREHPDTSVCFHPVRVIWTDGSAPDSIYPPTHRRRNLTVDALFKWNFIQTNSAMYRRAESYEGIPPDAMPLDWILHTMHAVRGEVAMLADTMSVYRRHPYGMWYVKDTNRVKFWQQHGARYVAMLDAMFGLAADNRKRQNAVLAVSRGALGQLASVPGPDGRALLLDTTAAYPRLYGDSLIQRLAVKMAVQVQRASTAVAQIALARKD